MSAGRYQGMRIFGRAKTIELFIDAQTSHELAYHTIAISVARGVANYLPPRLDPLFRRRLRTASPRFGLEQTPALPVGSARVSKVESILRMLPQRRAAVAVIDLYRSGSRLWLQKESDRCTTRPRACAGVGLGNAVILAPDAPPDSELGVGPSTCTLAVITISSEHLVAEQTMSVGVGALCAICGGTQVASTSRVIEPSLVTTLIQADQLNIAGL